MYVGDRLEDVSLELPMGWDLFRRSPKSVGVISNIAAKDFFPLLAGACAEFLAEKSQQKCTIHSPFPEIHGTHTYVVERGSVRLACVVMTSVIPLRRKAVFESHNMQHGPH